LGPDQWPEPLPPWVPSRWLRTASTAAQTGEKTGVTTGETAETTAGTVAAEPVGRNVPRGDGERSRQAAVVAGPNHR
jgi:hypothetical protein